MHPERSLKGLIFNSRPLPATIHVKKDQERETLRSFIVFLTKKKKKKDENIAFLKNEGFNNETETIKKNQTEILERKCTKIEMKNSVKNFNN